MPQSSTPSAAVTEDGQNKSGASSEVLQSYLTSHPSVTDRLVMGVKAQGIATSRAKTKVFLKEWQRDWDRYTLKGDKQT